MIARESDFVTEARAHATALVEAIENLKAMQSEWSAMDYGTTMDPLTGAHEGLTPADIGAVVVATADAMVALLATGHATNLYKVRS